MRYTHLSQLRSQELLGVHDWLLLTALSFPHCPALRAPGHSIHPTLQHTLELIIGDGGIHADSASVSKQNPLYHSTERLEKNRPGSIYWLTRRRIIHHTTPCTQLGLASMAIKREGSGGL